MKADFRVTARNVFAVMLLAGAVQIAAYHLAGSTVRSDGGFAVAQPDTLLYCQAARRIAEGRMFSFSEGVAASTGTTSVAYPFVLAALYRLGADGDSLLRAGFFLNAAFYLVFLLGWGAVARERFGNGIVGLAAAAALTALSGHSAFCALSQSDAGMWMAVSAVAAAGFAAGRARIYAPALLIAPWVRPEGAMLVAAFFLFSAIAAARRPEASSLRDLAVASSAAASAAGVFALNFALTGHAGFSSIAHKGHFAAMPFADAVARSAIDAVRMAKELLLGLPAGAPRDFFAMPLLGALFMWLGASVRDWRRCDRREAAFLAAAAAGFASVAASGWQGTNMDRYVVWFMPVAALFTANGLSFAAGRAGRAAAVPAAAAVAFAAFSAVHQAASFRVLSERTDHVRAFAAQCERTMTLGSPVGVMGWAGAAYEFSPRRIAHLPGIYSPEFGFGESMTAVIEILKRRPETRFYYMFSSPEGWDGLLSFEGGAGADGIEEMLLAGPCGFSLKKMKWEAFDMAAEDPPAKEGWSLSARVDVGYEPDEKAAGYCVATTYDQRPLVPFAVVAPLGGTNIVEAGRLILGGDEMTVPLVPGRDVEVVVRTLPGATATARGAYGPAAGGRCGFTSPMELHLEIDGCGAGHATFEIGEKGFTDARFTIPGKAIARSPCRVGFHGDHVACGYWFYQRL